MSAKYIPKWIEKKLKENINKDMKETKILNEIKEIVYRKPYSDRSVTWRYSVIKSYLRNNKMVNADILPNIKPPDELTEKVLQMNEEVRDKVKEINIDEELIYKIKSFVNSDNPYKLYIYLLFVSGLRLRELKDCKIKTKKGNKNIIACNLSKKREHEKEKEFEIKLMIPKTRFMKLYNKLMRTIKYSNIKHFDNNLQKQIKKILGANYKSHMLRKLYATYMQKFRNPQGLRLNSYIKNVLNHSVITTSINYTGINYNFTKDIMK